MICERSSCPAIATSDGSQKLSRLSTDGSETLTAFQIQARYISAQVFQRRGNRVDPQRLVRDVALYRRRHQQNRVRLDRKQQVDEDTVRGAFPRGDVIFALPEVDVRVVQLGFSGGVAVLVERFDV